MVKTGRIHLPNGQTIPNNGSGGGLKYGINTWLAANSAPTPEATTVPVQSSKPTRPLPVRRPPPPPPPLISFESIRSKVHLAQIIDTTDLDDPRTNNSEDDLDGELYDLFDVLATEKAEG
jgi:hypothetical protein